MGAESPHAFVVHCMHTWPVRLTHISLGQTCLSSRLVLCARHRLYSSQLKPCSTGTHDYERGQNLAVARACVTSNTMERSALPSGVGLLSCFRPCGASRTGVFEVHGRLSHHETAPSKTPRDAPLQ